MAKTPLQRQKEKCVKLAIENKLELYPNCTFCPRKANTCHHFIHQSRSNYLRLAMENLIPVCQKCHYKIHCGYEQLMTGELIKILGMEWYDKIELDSHKMIKDNIAYWTEKYKELLNNN